MADQQPVTQDPPKGGNGTSGEMYDQPYSAGEELRAKGRESPVKALIHLLLITAICGGAAAVYWSYVQDSKKITELLVEGRDLQKADDFASLKKARDKFLAANTIREDARAVSGIALVSASLWGLHGVDDLRAEAEKYAKRADELNVPNGDRFAAQGYLKIYSGQPAEAEKYLRSVLDRGAADPKILDSVGVALMVQGKTRDAREAFRKAIDLSAGAARYSAAMGDAYFRDGDYSNAWTFYNRAVVANAEHAKGRIGKILAKAKQGGKLKKFAKALKEILAEPPERLSVKDRAFAQYAAAEVALARGRKKEAQKFVDTGLQTNDKDARLHYLKAHLLGLEDKVDAALASFNKAIELDPYTAAYYFDAAEMMREKGRPTEAVSLIRRYGQKNYQSDEYKHQLGMALADAGKLDEAEKIFAKMVEDDEYDADASFGLGYVFELQQKWDKAREQYGTADQRRSGWGDPYFRMGYVSVGEGDPATAREYFQEAIKRYEKTEAPRKKRAKALLGIAVTWDKQGKKKKAAKARKAAEKILRTAI